jgi:hypothetical protein
MPTKKTTMQISENGQSRDATPEEVAVIEQTQADSLAIDAANQPGN